jgi:hypothetical protein
MFMFNGMPKMADNSREPVTVAMFATTPHPAQDIVLSAGFSE